MLSLEECLEQEIDQGKLNALLDQYKSQLPLFREHEVYKWQAAKTFRENWSIDEEDFPSMLEASLSDCENLLMGKNWYPKGMLLIFASENPDTVRQAFTDTLYDPRIPLFDKLGAFASISEELLEKDNALRAVKGEEPAQNHYQDSRSISVYLTMHDPSEYPLYKASVYKRLASELGVDYPANKFEKVVACQALFRQIANYLETERSDVIEVSDELLGKELATLDSKHMLLAQDIAYYCDYWRGELAEAETKDSKEYLRDREESFKSWMPNVYGAKESYANQCVGYISNKWQSPRNVRKFIVGYENGFNCEDIEVVSDAYEKACGHPDSVKSNNQLSASIGKYLKFLEYEQNSGETRGDHPSPLVDFSEWGPSSEDYDPGITVSQWMALIENHGVFTPVSVEMLVRMAQMGGAATCKELSEAYGDTPGHYNAVGSSLGERVVSELGIAIRTNQWGGNQYWSVPFLGKDAEKDQPGKFAWMIRPELMKALEESGVIADAQPDPYSDDDFMDEVYIDEDALLDMKALLRRKKNLILQGSPGTGKTFAAKRLAWCMMGVRDESRVQLVQFHQSSSYDDFVIGYRPKEDGGFEVAKGTFVKFCERAAADPGNGYFFIIDEINRANISKVFGELLMLIEADHRGDVVTLSVGDVPFAVPANVYVVGMMNTADRGLALIDYALRRRFAFFEMEPALRNDLFIERVEEIGDPKMPQLISAIELLNKVIAEDDALGRGFRIGHSYFCEEGDGEGTAEQVLKYEIEPLVEEYWFDDQKKARDEIKKLRDSLQ